MNSRASLALQMKRVMTYLKLSKKSEPILGQFGQCVVSTFLKEKEDIFEVADFSLQFYCEFISTDGIKHWFKGNIGKKNQIFNEPLFTPINQMI